MVEWLPTVSANTQRSQNDTVNRQVVRPGQTADTRSDYRAESGSISLRQPLYRKYNWANLSLAEAQVAGAEANFEKDRQDAGLRVAGAYVDVLFAQAQVRALQAQLEALDEQRPTNDDPTLFFSRDQPHHVGLNRAYEPTQAVIQAGLSQLFFN